MYKRQALQPDGKILLAGMCGSPGGPSRFCASRLHVDGTLDVSFDGPGVAGNGKFELPQIEQFQEAANAIAVQSDGKILLAGNCFNINAAPAANFCIARLNACLLYTSPVGTRRSRGGRPLRELGHGHRSRQGRGRSAGRMFRFVRALDGEQGF